MDGFFERFIRKIGISELSYFEDSHFLSQKYNKETDLLTIEIELGESITYAGAKMLLDAIDKAPFHVDVKFSYKKQFDEERIIAFLKDEFISKTGLTFNEMPSFKVSKGNITF